MVEVVGLDDDVIESRPMEMLMEVEREMGKVVVGMRVGRVGNRVVVREVVVVSRDGEGDSVVHDVILEKVSDTDFKLLFC